MAEASKRAASTTTLVIGKVEIPVGLFTTVAKPGKLQQFTTAGPNGGVLKAETRARAVPVTEQEEDLPDQPVHADPITGDTWPKRDPDAPVLYAPTEGDRGHAVHDRMGEIVTEMKTDADRDEPIDPAIRQAEVYADAIEESFGTRPEIKTLGPDGEYGRVLVEEGSGVEVPPEQVRRGVRLEDGRFVDCTGRLAQIEQETLLEQMTVVAFVDISQVPRATVSGAYYIGVGDEKADRALRLLYEALRNRRRAAVVKLTKRSRQSLGVIGWLGECLMLYELVWAEDFREAPVRAKRIQHAAVSAEQVAQMGRLVDAMSAPVSVLSELRDDAIALRQDLHDRAAAGEFEEIPEIPELVDAEVVEPEDEILAQLEASLAAT